MYLFLSISCAISGIAFSLAQRMRDSRLMNKAAAVPMRRKTTAPTAKRKAPRERNRRWVLRAYVANEPGLVLGSPNRLRTSLADCGRSARFFWSNCETSWASQSGTPGTAAKGGGSS